jgi:nucleoside-diphosphate-sugar epimerase
MINIFITGITGYIGGSVFTLIQNENYVITALVRKSCDAEKLKELGVNPIIGSLENLNLLISESKKADVVLNFADSDDVNAIKAIIKGLEQSNGKKILIHNSGAGVLNDDSIGNYNDNYKSYTDLDLNPIHKIPLTNPHRIVDQYIFDNLNNINTIIVTPPTIFGNGLGPFNKRSVQIPILIRLFYKIGHGATIDVGSNKWSHIHIEDLSNLYKLLLEKSIKKEISFGKEGYYFAENGSHSLYELTQAITKSMYKKKYLKTDKIIKLTYEEMEKYMGPFIAGFTSNSISIAERSRNIGWSPKHPDNEIFDTIDEEIDEVLKN